MDFGIIPELETTFAAAPCDQIITMGERAGFVIRRFKLTNGFWNVEDLSDAERPVLLCRLHQTRRLTSAIEQTAQVKFSTGFGCVLC